MRPLPRLRVPDSSLGLLTDGYDFISNRCDRLGTDAFETRLLLRRTVCLRGEAAARLVYDRDRFERAGAAPRRMRKTLLGEGGVQGLDGEAHRRRKALFLSLMTPDEIDRLAALAGAQWRAYAERWAGQDEVVLFEGAMELLCRAVCAWAGVPLPEDEVGRRTADFAAMIDGGGGLGLRYVRARIGRVRAERWAGRLVRQVREGTLEGPGGSALARIALFRDLDGDLLDEHDAAVEVLNVLRPTVAVARFVAFIAHALHEHPEARDALRDGDAGAAERFVHEVRRYYPFFPFVAARTRRAFEWEGYAVPGGVRVLLDLYGTDRHRDLWDDPEAFRPDRFRQWDGGAFDFVPQGGGDHFQNHRCAGEWVTIRLMCQAADVLTRGLRYDVPPQDLEVDRSRMPAVPESRFVMTNVMPTDALGTSGMEQSPASACPHHAG